MKNSIFTWQSKAPKNVTLSSMSCSIPRGIKYLKFSVKKKKKEAKKDALELQNDQKELPNSN